VSDAVALNPLMDASGLLFFKESLVSANCFLEYGCGGSTAYAVNQAKVKAVISVDTSLEWVEKVAQSLANSESRLLLKHCDVGPVVDWGAPLNRDRSQHFWRYMVTPWNTAKEHNLVPDLVLIDGRFRVASFLYSLLCARVGTTIMFDDYLDRPHYFVVERFCRLKEKHGRMGVFQVQQHYAVPDIVSAIAEYATVWA
jgi:hypothetical protein